jgi:hypothetical protein
MLITRIVSIDSNKQKRTQTQILSSRRVKLRGGGGGSHILNI